MWCNGPFIVLIHRQLHINFDTGCCCWKLRIASPSPPSYQSSPSSKAVLPVLEAAAAASTIIETLSKPINSYYDMDERGRRRRRDGIKCKKPNDFLSHFSVLLQKLSEFEHTHRDFETKIKCQNDRESTINWRKIRRENLFGVCAVCAQ